MISEQGSPDGTGGGVLDLLQWCGKANTATVTVSEAQAFWEMYHADGAIVKRPDEPAQP